jgi:hypothetical protein
MAFVLGAILIGGGITFSKRAYDLDQKAILDPMSLGVIAALIGAWLCYMGITGVSLFDW